MPRRNVSANFVTDRLRQREIVTNPTTEEMLNRTTVLVSKYMKKLPVQTNNSEIQGTHDM
jgi:hypothetical protein